jgi:hypothetical protein
MRIEIIGRNYTPGEKLKNVINKKPKSLPATSMTKSPNQSLVALSTRMQSLSLCALKKAIRKNTP